MTMNQTGNPLESLSFVRRETEMLACWRPDRSGDQRDCQARGAAYAEEFLAAMRAAENPGMFGSVIRAIATDGTYGPVEIGFCHAVGVELIGLRVVG